MTNNQLKKLADRYGLDLKYITKWDPPKGEDLRPLIAMPNLPKMTHRLSPRTLLGSSTWNHMRKSCYAKANDTCEICGDKPEILRRRQGHEAYSIDYEKGLVTFVRCFCLDSVCHLACIHNGRAYTLWKDKHPLYPTSFLLEGAERAFKIIASYNKDHPDADLRAYSTYIEYLKHEELRGAMLDLITKYHIKFYMEDPKKMAPWKSWRLVIGNQEYPTPYENEKAWKKAMEEAGKKDTARIMQKNVEEKFSGGVYNELNEIIKEVENESIKPN